MKSERLRSRLVPGLILAALGTVGTARAQNNNWINPSNGAWEVSANWSLGTRPTGAHAVSITNVSTKTVVVDDATLDAYAPQSVSASSLTVAAPSGATNTLHVVNTVFALDPGPFILLNNCTIDTRGRLLVEDAEMEVRGVFSVSGRCSMMNSIFLATGASASVTIGNGGSLQVASGQLRARQMTVGNTAGTQGTLTVSGGNVSVFTSLAVGDFTCLTTGIVALAGGSLFVTNAGASAALDIRSGSLLLQGGALTVDRLVITNACGRYVSTGPPPVIGTLVLGPTFDADGDGLGNAWETMFGFDPLATNGVNGATADPDSDGFDNGQEFLGGSDPTSASSFPQIVGIVASGNDILVKVSSILDRKYQLQRRDSLTMGGWIDVGSSLDGTGGLLSLPHTGGALLPQQQYRVKITRAP